MLGHVPGRGEHGRRIESPPADQRVCQVRLVCTVFRCDVGWMFSVHRKDHDLLVSEKKSLQVHEPNCIQGQKRNL